MTAILRIESRKRVRGTLILAGLFVVISAFFLLAFPGFAEEAAVIEAAFPGYIVGLLGFEELHTIEGFAGGYVYPLLWILLAGGYIASVSAGLIVDDIRDRRLDLLLSNPVSRESVVLQKVASLWLPLVVLNVVLWLVLYVGAFLISESIDPGALTMVHLLSIPYLLVCAGIGVVASVVANRTDRAQVAAFGLVGLLWLVDGLSELDEDFEWIGAVTPSRYIDPTAIFVHEEYAFFDAGVLLAAFLVLLGVAIAVFVRRDI